MPTAIPVASSRPDAPLKAGRRRVLRPGRRFTFAICLPIAWALVVLQPIVGVAVPAASASAMCSGWSSLTTPPDSIRVLRRRSDRIEVIPFRKYVITVMGKEWPSYLPQSLVEAGAVVVKQYAWYHAVYSSRAANGRCYDVRDGVTDQLYKPGRARVSSDHDRAVDATWNVTIQKDGRFIMTGYRRGEKVRCGRDATGYKLFARSAVDCARKGYSWRQILRTYYGQGISLVGDGAAAARIDAPASPETSVAPPATVPPETGVVPPETGVVPPSTSTTSPPDAGAVADSPGSAFPPAASPTGAVGGAQSGGLADSVFDHEQRLLLLWLASNSIV